MQQLKSATTPSHIFMEWQILSFPVILAFLLFIIMVFRTRNKLESHNLTLNRPPRPWKLPFFGNIHQLVCSQPHHRITDLAKKYGPVMLLQLGEISTIIISSPDAAKEVLKTHELNFINKPSLLVASIAFYNNKDMIFAPYGEYWRQLRKLSIAELFGAKRVQSFKTIRQEEVTNFIKSISTKAGLPVNLSKMVYSLVNGIVARVSIGEKCKNQEAFIPIMKEIFKAGAGLNIVDIFPSVKLFHLLSLTKFKVRRAHNKADKILEEIINERRVSKKKKGDNEVEDILDVLLNLQDSTRASEFPITDESIKGMILDVFFAGTDTSSVTVEWAMSEMLKNPGVMLKAQKEVMEVFSSVGYVDETILDQLKFLKLIIKETMRLHPPGPLLARECTQSCKILGYDIDCKTKVLINVWAIGRDPDYWTESEKFYPERFLNRSIDYNDTNFEFIPFGAGKRMCPGMLFGLTNVELILAHLLYHFDWKLSNGLRNEILDITEDFSAVTGRKRDLYLIPIPVHKSE